MDVINLYVLKELLQILKLLNQNKHKSFYVK